MSEISASLVKEATQRNMTILEVALEKSTAGELKHIQDGHLITAQEIKLALTDFKHLTFGGIIGH